MACLSVRAAVSLDPGKLLVFVMSSGEEFQSLATHCAKNHLLLFRTWHPPASFGTADARSLVTL